MTEAMHDHLAELRAAARAVAAGHLATDSRPDASLDAKLWDQLHGLGLSGLGAPESVGGSGGTLLDATTVLAELATARVPYAEGVLVGAHLLGQAGVGLPAGPLTAGWADVAVDSGRLTGSAARLPYARDCEHFVLVVAGEQPMLHLVARTAPGVALTHGHNIAGEARDTVTLCDVVPDVSTSIYDHAVAGCRLRLALGRAAASAAVAAEIVERTSRYVSEREQFGRPLVKFQVVQHTIATMAANATAMQTAVTAATMALLADSTEADLLVAAAKAETATLARDVTAAAHQAHGAIGFTREHVLGALTTRLWAWRDEYGNERYWHQQLGEMFAGQDVWQLVTGLQ